MWRACKNSLCGIFGNKGMRRFLKAKKKKTCFKLEWEDKVVANLGFSNNVVEVQQFIQLF